MTVTVACILWDGEPADPDTEYGIEHVYALREMVARHLPGHRFVCFSDYHIAGVNTRFIPPEARKLGARYPKLWLWSEDVGLERMLYLDLDCVLVGSLVPLIERTEDVVLWRDPTSRKGRVRYNTSMMLMTCASRPEVWTSYDGSDAPGLGTDQAWVRHVLGPNVDTWGPEDGVLSYRTDCTEGLPEHARAVFFHGDPKPWGLGAEHWAHRAWRGELAA